MGRARKVNTDLPVGLYLHKRTYRSPAVDGGYKTFGQNKASAIALYLRWKGTSPRSKEYCEDPAVLVSRKFKALVKNAQNRSIELRLTREELDQIMINSGGRCVLTGIKFSNVRPPGARVAPWAPSLDRISNRSGYVVGNVRMVVTCLNLAINEFGEETFVTLASSYLKHAALAQISLLGKKSGEINET